MEEQIRRPSIDYSKRKLPQLQRATPTRKIAAVTRSKIDGLFGTAIVIAKG
jgi:hypothetical protein